MSLGSKREKMRIGKISFARRIGNLNTGKRILVVLQYTCLVIWNHKKRKDSLETRALLLMFSLELEICGMAVQSIHQSSEKCQLL